MKERGVLEGNFDKGTRADVSKFGNRKTTNYGFRSEFGKKHVSLPNHRKRN
jgi:hypothetical protein